MLQPVGPLSPATYWARRIAVTVALIVVLVGLIWLVRGVNGGTPAPGPARASGAAQNTVTSTSGPQAVPLTGELAAPQDTAAAASPTTTGPAPTDVASPEPEIVVVATVPDSAPTPEDTEEPAAPTPRPVDPYVWQAEQERIAAEKAAKATKEKDARAEERAEQELKAAQEAELASRTYDAQGRLVCPDHFLTLVATSRSAEYPVGARPVLGVIVTNTGDQACVRDLSGTLQEYRVYAADDRQIWSTDDCFPGTGSELRELAAGESVRYDVTWSGTTSVPGCAEERVPAGAGEYQVEARIGELVSERGTFVLTG